MPNQTLLDALKVVPEELASFNRFCDICEDFDADGYDVPKDMMKRLAMIGLVRSCGFSRYETTSLGNLIREDLAPLSQPERDSTIEECAVLMDAKGGKMVNAAWAAETLRSLKGKAAVGGDAERLEFIAKNGMSVRKVNNGHKALAVWGCAYPVAGAPLLDNLRAAIDAAIQSAKEGNA
jgi:hypothetical protein